MKLSIIIPVYNERRTFAEILKQVQAFRAVQKEIIIVDDFSQDGTRDIIQSLADSECIALFHDRNLGKGAAIRTAQSKISGDVVLIQDADLEYSPKDYPQLTEPIMDGRADVVYGSRFLGGTHRVLFFWHYFANRFFTLLTNVLYNINLSDMGTCYKVFRADVFKSIRIKSDRFGFEPEITAKVCKKKLRIFETPISYNGRTYSEGKKITWKDAFTFLWCLIKFRIVD